MLWRSSEHVLVQQGESFVLLKASGEVAGRFKESWYSDEDDLWHTVQRIEGDRLVQRITIQHFAILELYEEKVLAQGLVPATDQATKDLVEAALKADAEAQERDRVAGERAAAARVDAIEGARAHLGADPLVARAQTELTSRISRWSDERAGELLRTLIVFSKVKNVPALHAFVRGCLLACYASNVPPLPNERQHTPNAELAKALAKHAAVLDDDALGQEYADANSNASSLRRAAAAIRWAAQCLE